MKTILRTWLAAFLLAGCGAASPAPIPSNADVADESPEASEDSFIGNADAAKGPEEGDLSPADPNEDDNGDDNGGEDNDEGDDGAEPPQPPPKAKCTGAPETESNNSAGTADALPMNGVVCGRLSGGDVDFFKITARRVRLQFGVEADASLRITAPGSQQRVTGAATVTFGSGELKTYLIEVTSASGRSQIYGLKLVAE